MSKIVKKRITILILFLLLCLVITGLLTLWNPGSQKAMDDMNIDALPSESDIAADKSPVFNAITMAADIKSETSEQKTDAATDPVTDEGIKLTDIYSESGHTAEFKCYDKDAASYEWEYYDFSLKDWIPAADSDVYSKTDELQRMISVFKVKALPENHELMVKCILHFQSKDDKEQTASLFILEKKVKEIIINDFTADANTFLHAAALPVKVVYEDGLSEEITGLNGLHFITTEETKDYSATVSGNRIETTTTVTTEYDYLKIGLEEKEVRTRYHTSDTKDTEIETVCLVSGKDMAAPAISNVIIQPYDIRNVDEPVTITVDITAEDNETPYPYLEYAFVISDQEPGTDDWTKKSTFDITIVKNGTYIACVRDQSGNIAKMEKEVITVDTKAPVISNVSLKNETGWCKSNMIIVAAKDSGNITYRFQHKADRSDSEWITYSEYAVDRNGTWIIQARDTAGNLSEAEIVVNNIDKAAPVIQSIKVIKGDKKNE